ncbi:MAG: gas vesicle protein [Isosphaeraceae bacterium]
MSNYSEHTALEPADSSTDLDDHHQPVSLCETLDRILNTGVVLAGEIVISVAGVDLIYLNLQVLLSSIETASRGVRRTAATTIAKPACEP